MLCGNKGPWNEYRPVGYDYENPWKRSLLSEYLEIRRGNCVSMPTLLLAIVEKVDPEIPIYGAHAPMHMYCILKDRATSEQWNAEATNGGASRDSHIIKTFHVPMEGIGKAYMRPLPKKEYLAALITDYLAYGELNTKALNYVNLALTLGPQSPSSFACKGTILHTIGWEQAIAPIKAKDRQPTPKERREIERLDREGNKYFDAARRLGWRDITEKDRELYLEAIRQGN